jgi:hypothetical protein
MTLNPWATATASSLPSSGPTLPRDVGGSGGGSFPSVLVENLWNTARPQVCVNARHPPLEDAFAVGGMAALLPPFPQVVDTQGTEAFASHHSLPTNLTVALLPASLHAMLAPASSAASTVSRAPVLDAFWGLCHRAPLAGTKIRAVWKFSIDGPIRCRHAVVGTVYNIV